MCDDYNNLHCFGLYQEPDNDTRKTAYYFYNYSENKWYEPEVIGQYSSSDPFTDITVYNNNPYFVWREAWGSWTNGGDGTFYKHKNAGQWSETEMIVEDPWVQKIDVVNNKVFIVDCEKEDDDYKVVFYQKDSSNQWEGQIVIVNHFISTEKLFHDKDFLYILLNGKIDDPEILDTYIMKMPLDSILITSVNKIKTLDNETVILNQNYLWILEIIPYL